MTFNYTKGKEANYVVLVYYDHNENDRYYTNTLKEAKNLYAKLLLNDVQGRAISIYDLKNDIRKEYINLETIRLA